MLSLANESLQLGHTVLAFGTSEQEVFKLRMSVSQLRNPLSFSLQLAARIAVSNLHKNTKKSFSDT
jgi:hypothetical protein